MFGMQLAAWTCGGCAGAAIVAIGAHVVYDSLGAGFCVQRKRVATSIAHRAAMRMDMNRRGMSGAAAAIVMAGLLAAGCASVADGSRQILPITANVPEAKVTIFDKRGAVVYSGPTPARVSLQRADGVFNPADYRVRVSAPGYQDYEIDLEPGFNATGFANVFNGVIIGSLIVDPITGAFVTHRPKQVNAELWPTRPTAQQVRRARPAAGPAPRRGAAPELPAYARAQIEIRSIYDLSPEERAELMGRN